MQRETLGALNQPTVASSAPMSMSFTRSALLLRGATNRKKTKFISQI